MTEIFAERSLKQTPITERAFALQARACLEMHRVECQESMLALSGERMLCHFKAPDLEAARMALRQYDAEFDSVWGATVYEADAMPDSQTARSRVLEEIRYETPIEIADLKAEDEAAAAHFASHDIWRLRSIVPFDRRSVLRIYRAPDAKTLCRLREEMGVPLGSVWAYRVISGCPLIIGENHILSALGKAT